MAGIEEAFEKFVTRVSGRERSKAEEPLSKYKSYSEQELLENIEAKRPNQLQSFSQEDYQLNTMPMFEPRDVAPPRSYSPMPNIYDTPRLSQVDLANGGVASMFRERPGFQEGGEIRRYESREYNPVTGNFERVIREGSNYFGSGQSDPIVSVFDKEKGFIDLDTPTRNLFNQPTNFPTIDPFSGRPYLTDPNAPVQPIGPAPPDNYYDEIPTVDPFSGQPVSAQDLTPPTPASGYTEEGIRKIAEDTASREQAMANAFNNIPTVDPFSGQRVSMQDQMAFAQPQADIFPQQNIPQPPSPVDQFIGERRFQSEADAAARSGIPFTKTIQDFIGNLYSGPQIAEMQERTFGTSGLPGATGLVSDLRHATAASQVRDKIADAVSMGYFNPAGLIPQSLGLFGSQILGAANEIQSIRPNMQSIRDIGEDLRANFLGAVQVPYGQTASATYNQLLNNPTIAAQRSQQEAAARVTPRMTMAYGGLTNTIPPVKGPDSQGVESLFRRRYN